MKYQIGVESVTEQKVAAARQRTTFRMVSQEIGPLLSRPWAFLKERSQLRVHGHNVAIYWDATGQGSIEVGVQVVAPFDATEDVICSATPAGTVATTIHLGPYDQLGGAHEAIRTKENGREIGMPYWEVYGDWDDDPARLRTDVFYLLK